jgi:acetyltransferase-like isoleucine patch superfamily enzyme
VKRGSVKLGKFSCVLTNAVVVPGVTLGRGAVLAAGSVALCDIPDWQIWGGVPARYLKQRMLTTDQRLKMEQA